MDSDENREVSEEEFVAYFMIHECKKVMQAEEDAMLKKADKTSKPSVAIMS